MKQVFLNADGKISTEKNATTTHTAEMHFYQSPPLATFQEEIDYWNDNLNQADYPGEWLDIAKDRDRNKAFAAAQHPESNGCSIIYFENVVAI